MTERRATVMVVDDDVDVCEVYSEVLIEAGYDVLSAHNGREALQLLREAPRMPDLILVDLMMPLMDGGTFQRELAENPALRDVPVVVMSAGRRPSNMDDVGYLQKPVSLEDLLETVATYTQRG